MSKEKTKGIWGVSKQGLHEELNDYTTKDRPRFAIFNIIGNEDGDPDKNGKCGSACLYCDFKTWMRLRYVYVHDPDHVYFSVHIGRETLVEGKVTAEFIRVLKKCWQGNLRGAAEKIEDWMWDASGILYKK